MRSQLGQSEEPEVGGIWPEVLDYSYFDNIGENNTKMVEGCFVC